MYKNILIPLDGSKRAEAVLEPIRKLAQQQKSKVTFLRVEEPALMLEYDEVIDEKSYRRNRQKQVKQSSAYLTNLKNEFSKQGIETESELAFGSVLETILNTAEGINCDLVAMATGDLHDVSPVSCHSVAVGLMQRVDRPLLLIRNMGTLGE